MAPTPPQANDSNLAAWSEDEIARLRAETPGTRERLHLNNAGSALPPQAVLDVMIEHLRLEARIGGYEAAAERAAAIREAYSDVGRLVGVPAQQIAYVENATAAYAQALSSIPFERGDVLLTSREDYVSNQIMFLSLQKRFGIRVERCASLAEGGIDLDDLRRRLAASRPRLLALTHVPTNSGLVQPVAEAGALAKEFEVLYLVDVCQSLGQRPLDMNALHADFLTATSRKFLRGPRGCGFLAVSQHVLDSDLEPLFIDLQGADWTAVDTYTPKPSATRFENWEFAYALVLGTGCAARLALDLGLERIAARTTLLAQHLRDGLEARGFPVLDRGRDRCAIVTTAIPTSAHAAFMQRIQERGLNATASLRAFGRIDFDDKDVDWALRLSPHYYNTEQELDAALEIVSSSV